MRYFTIYWESGNRKTYAQIVDEKPTDEFEKGKEDFCSVEFDDSDESRYQRNVDYMLSMVRDCDMGKPGKEFAAKLLSGEKIELDSYDWDAETFDDED